VDLSTLANVATALTVIAGVFFALLEARRARQDREEHAAFATIGSREQGAVCVSRPIRIQPFMVFDPQELARTDLSPAQFAASSLTENE